MCVPTGDLNDLQWSRPKIEDQGWDCLCNKADPDNEIYAICARVK